MTRNVPSHVALFLFLLFFVGFAITVLAFVDLHWNHWLLKPADNVASHAAMAAAPSGARS